MAYTRDRWLMGLVLSFLMACTAVAPAAAASTPVPQMIDFTLQVEEEDFLREIAASEMEIAKKLALTMDQVGWETIAFLRSVTGETSPPARPGEPARQAHPGHWADITSNLANAYRFELYAGGKMIRWTEPVPIVSDSARGTVQQPAVRGSIPATIAFPLELRFLNSMEYAAVLEARDGYWVLREITGAGGPVARALRTVLNRVDPSARLYG